MSPSPQSEASTMPGGVFDPASLIRRHQAGVWRYLRLLGCDPAEADDLTQETFLALLRSGFEVRSDTATAAFLRKVAYNSFIDVRRRAGRVYAVENVEELDQAWTEWFGRDDGDQAIEALRDCMTELTDRARKALEMRFRDNASRESIAEALGIGEHGAKNLMQRAKQQLRSCIEGKIR